MSQSLHVPEDPIDFAEGQIMIPTGLYQVGNLYLLDITPFSHLRETCELEDVNEWRRSLVLSCRA